MKKTIRCASKGYTLIEILVALTIVGLLFGFGFVSFRDFARRQTISGAADSLRGDIRLTQSDAISGVKPDDINCNSPYVLLAYNFNIISSSEYRIDAVCSGPSANVVVKDVVIPSDISISTPSPNPIQFKVLGQGTNIASGSNATINFTQTGTTNTAIVSVSSGGEIQ